MRGYGVIALSLHFFNFSFILSMDKILGAFMEKKFLSPFFAGIFVVLVMIVYYVLCYAFRFAIGPFDIYKTGISEAVTYLFYGFSFGILVSLAKDYLKTPPPEQQAGLVFCSYIPLGFSPFKGNGYSTLAYNP